MSTRTLTFTPHWMLLAYRVVVASRDLTWRVTCGHVRRSEVDARRCLTALPEYYRRHHTVRVERRDCNGAWK